VLEKIATPLLSSKSAALLLHIFATSFSMPLYASAPFYAAAQISYWRKFFFVVNSPTN